VQFSPGALSGWPKRIQQLIAAVLLLCIAWFVSLTIHWPLVGDASLMHYIVFLMDHGFAPYRDIVDINFPGCYLPDWTVVHLFGASALVWRLYDLLLLAIAMAAMAVISRRSGWFPAVWAGCLFALIHGRDGLNQVGQRDLTAGVLLLTGTACLFWGTRRGRAWPAGVFGVCAGLATMIKPTLAPFLLLVLCDLRIGRNLRDGNIRNIDPGTRRRVVTAFLTWLLPVVACLGWLWMKGDLRAFWHTVSVLAPYHASLGHAPGHTRVRTWLSPVMPIIVIWLVVLGINRLRTGPLKIGSPSSLSDLCELSERRTLLWAAALGALSYLMQAKGYPYHRYPFLLFLLILMAIDLTDALARTGAVQALSAGVLLWAGLGLGPSSALKASRYNWYNEEFRLTLQSDLQQAARSLNVASLSGQVQCLDTISGCINTLYDMQLLQTSGFLYDEFLFHPSGPRAISDTRVAFWTAMQAHPPLVLVVSDPLFPSGPDRYAKLEQWPEFFRWLNQEYGLEVERHPSLPERWVGNPIVPLGYRIYIRRSAGVPAEVWGTIPQGYIGSAHQYGR
jgi:hypothetical protein